MAVRCCYLTRSIAEGYERQALEAGLSWPLPFVDDAGERVVPAATVVEARPVPDPDYDPMDRESRRKVLTKQSSWHEYRASNPSGFAYSKLRDRLRDRRAA